MSLHKDYEPIQGQFLNRSPPPSLDIAVNELVREEAYLNPFATPIEQPMQSRFDSSGSSNRRK